MRSKYKILIASLLLFSLVALRIKSLPIGRDYTSGQTAQKGYYDYRGVIHFHTNYSGDATGTFEEIAKEANQQQIDFMISTDHNTLQPLYDHKEGWYENTLVLAGEEISLEEGYLLALGAEHLTVLPGEKTEQILADLASQGAILLIAHPNHPRWRWRYREESGISGQEVLDLADQWYSTKKTSLISGIFFYPFNPSAAFLQLYERPVETLENWDRRTLHRNFIGIFAPDFHQAIRITRNLKIPFPKSDKILLLAHDHILLKNPLARNLTEDKKILYEAIRNGHLYFALDVLGSASGFWFSAQQPNRTAWMGDQMPAGIQTNFSVKLPQTANGKKTLIRVFHNGSPIFTTKEKDFNFTSSGEGAYRIEVEATIPTFWGYSKNIVWIYSNPIYLR